MSFKFFKWHSFYKAWIGHSTYPLVQHCYDRGFGFSFTSVCRFFLILACVTFECSHTVELQGPTFIQEPPDQIEFSNNTGTSIFCAVHGVPKPTVTWVLSNGDVLSNVVGLREVHSNGSLNFMPFRPEEYRQDIHSAIYRCQATNAFGSIISRYVHVRAVVKQYYEVHVYDEYVINGNTAVLKCNIPSFVRDYVSATAWIKEGASNSKEVLHSGGRYTVHSTGELHIRNSKESDGKSVSYRCKTLHRLTGESKLSASAARLIVTEPKSSVPPKITHAKSIVLAQEGDTVELPCAAQGYPLPSYTWRRINGTNTKHLGIDSNRLHLLSGSMQIRSVTVSDTGTYQCIVNNTVGEEKQEVELKVTAPLLVFLEPKSQLVDVGKSAAFRCSYSGFPVSDVHWIKDSRPLVNSQRIRHISSEHLQIQSVQREDRGMYQCFIKSGLKTAQATAELRLGDAKPQLVQTFNSQILQPGSSLSLICVAIGNPPPQLKWTVDDIPLRATDRILPEQKMTAYGDVISYVNITNVRTEDGGEYKCTASNRVGNVAHKQRIDIYGSPFIKPMRNISAVSGSSIYIQCVVAGYPINSIVWERDRTVLPINHRQKVFHNGTLVVHNVQRTTDAGLYTCIVKGEDPTRKAQGSVYVIVMNPPKISPFSFPRDIQEGMRATITCSVFHGDQPISVSWLKDGHPIHPTSDLFSRSIDELTSTLVVQHITPKDNGNYTCVARNAAAAVNYTAQLLVLVPPRWIYEPQDSSVISGKNVIIDCQADGLPKPSITWKKAIGRLPGEYFPIDYSSGRNYMYPNGSLLLTSIEEKDGGYYLCQSNNSVGAGLSKLISLKVHVPVYFEEKFKNQTARKGREAVLRCEAKGDMPITIEWKLYNQRVDLKKKSNRFSVRETSTATGLASQLIISKTSREDTTEYSCFAINDYGKDQAWIRLTVQEPPEAPEDVKVMAQNSRSINVSWTPPFDGNSPILRSVIQVKAVSSYLQSSNKNVVINGNKQTMAVVTDLKPSAEYVINVAAENMIGIGLASNAVQINMAEEAPDGAPQNVTIEAIGSQTLKISWEPPKRENWNGDIKGYMLQYRQFESEELFSIKITDVRNERHEQFVLQDLFKFTKYVITVQAFNEIGFGPRSDEVVARTQEDVPSQSPQSIKCIPTSSQSLRVSWDSPAVEFLNGVLRGYRVVYRVIEEINTKPKLEFHSTSSTETEIQGLGKYSNYSIQVQAFTAAGDGAKSEPVYCRTKEDVPGPPAGIKVLPMSSDAIIVSWIPPLNPNGIIIKYTVYMLIIDNYQKSPLSFTLPATQFYYEARSLTENLQYQFWVKASTAVGEGEKTRVISNSPVSTVPAKIASFPVNIFARRQDHVKLPCRAVGIPTPDRIWSLMGKQIETNSRIQILADGSLNITSYRPIDAGNYSCLVQNIYDKDEIFHCLFNKHPPSTPVISIGTKTQNSITVLWKLDEYGELPLTGVSLYYKTDPGKWNELHLSSLSNEIVLDKLICGTRYQLYMVAYNSAGVSEPSDVVTVSTSGFIPEIPKPETILEVNSTFVILHLVNWSDGGCPIIHFIVEYKEKESPDWLAVANKIPPKQSVVITDLLPNTYYSIRVNAINGAGTSSVNYDFITLRISNGYENDAVMERPHSNSKFFLNLNVLMPIISAIVIIVAIFVIVCILVHRRRYNGYFYTVRSTNNQDARNNPSQREALQKNEATIPTTKNEMYDQTYASIQSGKSFDPSKSNISSNDSHNVVVHDDISPYATFQLPSTRYTDAGDIHFHTFGYDKSKMADYPPSPQFQYTKVRKKLHRLSPNSRNEGIQMNVRPSASKEHLNPLHTATLKKEEELMTTVSLHDESIIPSAPPAESDFTATDSDTPDIAPHTVKKGIRTLNYVPDILDHRQDSSTSNETTPEMDCLPSSKRENNRERRPRTRRIALHSVASIDRNFSDETSMGHPFMFTKTAKPPPGFCDGNNFQETLVDHNLVSQTNQEQNPKSPSGLAAVEEELIALLKRGAEQNNLSKDDGSNYNNINV